MPSISFAFAVEAADLKQIKATVTLNGSLTDWK